MPEGWVKTRFKAIAKLNPRIKPDKYPDDLEVTFIPMKAVQEETGNFSKSETRHFGKVKKGYTSFENGDLIFAKITPCMENGKAAILEDLKNGIGYGSTEFHVIRLFEDLSGKFFFFYITQRTFRESARRIMTGSAGQLRVPKSYLEEVEIPLPPLPEQHRIVAKIESLFTQLDKGVEQLTAIQQQLKTYRQAVLKAAFEGKLTAAWREEHQPPPASALLVQIKTERERQYEKEVADWKTAVQEWEANGKDGKRPGKPRKLKEFPKLTEEELEELSKLPKEWVWVKINDVVQCLDYRRKPINKKERLSRPGNIPYYGANGQVGWIDDYLFDEELVLVVEDETFTGRQIPFAYKISGKSWVNNHAHVLKNEPWIDIDFLNYSLWYYPFTALTTGTTGRKKLTQNALMK